MENDNNNNFDQNQNQNQNNDNDNHNNNNNNDNNSNNNNSNNSNNNNNSGNGPDQSLQSLIREQRQKNRDNNNNHNGTESNFSRSRGGGGGSEMGIVTDRTVRVYIKNIPFALIEKFDDEALLNEITEASNGGVVRYTMFSDKSGRYTGQAMCTFASTEAAEMTILALNGKKYTPSDAPLELEQAKDHGVVLSSRLQGMEREHRLAEQPWRRGDRFGRMYNDDGSLKPQFENHNFGAANNYGIGQGRGGGGGFAGRGGRNENFGAGRGGGGGSSFYRGPATQDGLNGALENWNNSSNNNDNSNNDKEGQN